MFRNSKGFTGLEILGVLAAVALVGALVLKTGNPFDRSADPANRRTASEISGRDIVEITKVVGESPQPVTVRVDRSVDAKSEVTDPKLTLGQKIGRFVAGLGTWAILLIGGGCILVPGFGLALLAWSRHVWRTAFKNTVSAIRDVDNDTYEKLKPRLAARHDKRDKRLVDQVKAELH